MPGDGRGGGPRRGGPARDAVPGGGGSGSGPGAARPGQRAAGGRQRRGAGEDAGRWGDAGTWGAARSPPRAGGKFGEGCSPPFVSFGEIIPSGKGCAGQRRNGEGGGEAVKAPSPRGPFPGGAPGPPPPLRGAKFPGAAGTRLSPESGGGGGWGGGEGGSAAPCPVRAASGVDRRAQRKADLFPSAPRLDDFDGRWGGGPAASHGAGGKGPGHPQPGPARPRRPPSRCASAASVPSHGAAAGAHPPP